jgi:hypothetical protein
LAAVLAAERTFPANPALVKVVERETAAPVRVWSRLKGRASRFPGPDRFLDPEWPLALDHSEEFSMRCAPSKMHFLAALLVVAACGGQAGSDLFAGNGGSGGSATGASGAAGTATTGGTATVGGTATTGGTTTTAGTGFTTGGTPVASGGGGGVSATGGAGMIGGGGAGAGRGGASAGVGGSIGGGSAGTSGNGAGGNASAGGGAVPSAGAAGKGGGGVTSGAGAAGKGGGGISAGGAPSAGVGGQATCEMLIANLPKLLSAAQTCDNSLNRLPCSGFVNNECGCPVPVELPNSSVTQSYVSAIAQVMKCGVACPDVLCREPTSARCQTEGGQAMGRCVAN